jgi:transposase InsO family protein
VTEIAAERFVSWIGVARGKFFAWKTRYGKMNEQNGHVPRDHWLLDEEKRTIIAFHERVPLEGYRRLTFMMIDQEVVAASPFYYLCSILDGVSRAIVHWEICAQMTEADVECILVRAHERYPNERPRIISDNGPQFIAKDFKEFIRLTGIRMSGPRRTTRSPNGKSERWHKTLKADAIRPGQPQTLEEARAGGPLSGALQHRPATQRDRLRHPGRPHRRLRSAIWASAMPG